MRTLEAKRDGAFCSANTAASPLTSARPGCTTETETPSLPADLRHSYRINAGEAGCVSSSGRQKQHVYFTHTVEIQKGTGRLLHNCFRWHCWLQTILGSHFKLISVFPVYGSMWLTAANTEKQKKIYGCVYRALMTWRTQTANILFSFFIFGLPSFALS